MAITSINSQVLTPIQTIAPGRGASGNPDDPAALRIAGQADKSATAAPDNPTAVVAAENAEKTREEQRNARQPDANQVKSAVEKLNDFVKTSNSSIQFSVDEESGIRVIKVVDPDTKEIIRQMPSEEVVEIAKAIGKLQGLLIKQTA